MRIATWMLVVACGVLVACGGDDDGAGSGGMAGAGTGGTGGGSGAGTGGAGGMGGAGTGGMGGSIDAGPDGADDAGDDMDAQVIVVTDAQVDSALPDGADAQVDSALPDGADQDASCIGLACELCVLDQCGAHGDCMETVNGPQCTCDTGYAGSTCGDCDNGYVISSSTGLCVMPQQRQASVHELRGNNCPAGGNAMLSGLDLNDDGTLSGNEITSTTYQCFTPMVRTGDYYVNNLAELQALEGVTEITGTLFVDASSVTSLGTLPTLTRIGALTIRNNTLLTDVGAFLALERVAGDVTIENNIGLLSAAGLEQLRVIEGGLSIRNNSALASLTGFGQLTTVVNSLSITNNALLSAITGLSSLSAIGYQLLIADNAQLETIEGISALSDVGRLELTNLPNLASIDGLTSLATIRGVLIIDNTGITTLDAFNAVTQVITLLRIRNNDSLTSIEGFDALTTIPFVQGDFSNFWGPATLEIVDNDALLSVDAFHALQDIRREQDNGLGVLTITGNPLLMSLQAFDAVTALSHLRVAGSPMLSDLGPFAALTQAYNIAIVDTQADAILLPALTTSDTILITDALIEELDLPLLTHAALLLIDLPALTTIDAPSFVGLSSEGAEIADAPLLTTLNLPALTSYSGIVIDGFAGTSLGDWPLLTTFSGLRITNSPSLTSLPNAPLLTTLNTGSVSGLDLRNNDALTSLGFAGLMQITWCFDLDPDCNDFGGNPCVCAKVALRDNNALATCTADAFVTRLGLAVDDYLISGNNDAGTCN